MEAESGDEDTAAVLKSCQLNRAACSLKLVPKLPCLPHWPRCRHDARNYTLAVATKINREAGAAERHAAGLHGAAHA